MQEAYVRRCAWLLLKVYGVREAPRVAAGLRDALAAVGDEERLPIWERVARAVELRGLAGHAAPADPAAPARSWRRGRMR